MKKKILVVEDEPDALELIEFNLKSAGFDVTTATDGADALKQARRLRPDLIVLDVMLPEIDGLEICKILRRDAVTLNLPIIMLTAKAAEIDRIVGLEVGADDYLTKPFSPRELLLRIKKLLQRQEAPAEKNDFISVGPLSIDLLKHEVKVNGRAIDLTATEFNLLVALSRRPGRVLSRDQLLTDVWKYDTLIDTRTVDTHMRRLRDKLGGAAKCLDTVRGVGYRFVHG